MSLKLMSVKRTVSLLALLGMGLSFPMAAYSMTPVRGDEVAQSPAVTHINAAIKADVRIEAQADGTFTHELTFTGNANELIVVNLEREDGAYVFSRPMRLYTPVGDRVLSGAYPDLMTFESSLGLTRAFLLPETGTYRLVLASASSLVHEPDPMAGPPVYLAQVSVASYYERLMIAAEEQLDEDAPEAALALLDLAVDESPELPGAYFSRLLIYVVMMLESPAFEDRLDTTFMVGDTEAILALGHEMFKSLDVAEQAVALSDLRQLNRLYSGAVNSGEIEPEADFPVGIFDEMAAFLETGVPTDTLRMALFGTSSELQEEDL